MSGDIKEMADIISSYDKINEFEFSSEDYVLKQSLSLLHLSIITRNCEERFFDRKVK